MTLKTRRFLWYLAGNICVVSAVVNAALNKYEWLAVNLIMALIFSTALLVVTKEDKDNS